MDSKLKWSALVPWVLLLAFLSVGSRNFEEGITQDGPMYATIARTIVRTGEWFRLDAGVPEFRPFASHPHLGLWILAAALKVLPSADWAIRIPGHLFYVAFLLLFFAYLRNRHNEKTAVWAVLLLFVWYRFSNPFSNVKLDPVFLFLGTSSVLLLERAIRVGSLGNALGAGTLLAGAFLTKGLAALGFGFAWALLYAVALVKTPRRLREGAGAAVALVSVMGLYYLAVKASRIPEFFQIYFGNVGIMAGELWTLPRVFNARYWIRLLDATYFLAPICLLTLRRRPLELSIALPWALLAGFVFLYAPAGLAESQYWLTILPWIAWLLAAELGSWSWVKVSSRKLVQVSAGVAAAGICLVQYLPFPTHGIRPGTSELVVREEVRRGRLDHLLLEVYPALTDYITGSRYVWYGDLSIEDYVNGAKPPPAPTRARTGYMLQVPLGEKRQFREAELQTRGWCLVESVDNGSLWKLCDGKS